MRNILAFRRPRFTNLSKKLGTVRISSFTKHCAAFLGLYICFILIHQINGFEVQLWVSLCLITVVAEWVINYFTRKKYEKGNLKSDAANDSSVYSKFKRLFFRVKESSLTAPWNSRQEENSHRESSIENEEMGPLLRSVRDRLGSAKEHVERESRSSTASKGESPYSRLHPEKESPVSSSIHSTLKDFEPSMGIKVHRDAPWLSSFRDQRSPATPKTTTLPRVSDERENLNYPDFMRADEKEEPTLTYEKSDPYSATMLSYVKSTSSAASSIPSVTLHSDPKDGQSSHSTRLKSIDDIKIEIPAFPSKRSASLRSLSCFACCGGKHQFQLP